VVACALAAILCLPASASALNPVSFSQVGDMTSAREAPGAARLPDGRVLVVGGHDGTDYVNTAEIFDPNTASFSALGATMTSNRWGPGVAPLPDGRVLIAGGYDGAVDVASAEVFNPSTGTFSAVGSMSVAREEPAVLPLPDGRVLIAGGYSNVDPTATGEIFDPKTNTFGPGPSLPVAKYGVASAVISGGRGLVAGGYDTDYLASAHVFDPSSGAFSPVANLPNPNYAPAGASLPQGRALVAGGYDNDAGDETTRSLIFDPATGTFSSAGIGNLIGKRQETAAVELKDGRVLVAGGTADGPDLRTAEVLSVPSNSFKAKVKGRKVIFNVSNEGVGQATDVSTKVATTAKKKKPKLLKTTSRHGGPGKIKVKIKLTKAGAAKLAEKGKLAIRVVYTPDQGLAATKKLKLRGS
jgi:WD40 repeat protein